MFLLTVLLVIFNVKSEIIYGPYGYNNISEWNIIGNSQVNEWENYFEIGGRESIDKSFNFSLYKNIIIGFLGYDIMDDRFHLWDNETCLIEYKLNQISLQWEILVTYTHDDMIQMRINGTEQSILVNSIFDDKLVGIRFRNNATDPNRRCYFTQITLYGTPFIKSTSLSPTIYPTNVPSISPSISPTQSPTQSPTLSNQPTNAPTQTTFNPTKYPSYIPTFDPTLYPSKNPSSIPSKSPSYIATNTILTSNTTDSNINPPKNYIDDMDFQFLTESKVFYVIIGAAGGCCVILVILMIILFCQSSKYAKECETAKVDGIIVATKVKNHLQSVHRVKSKSKEAKNICEMEYINSDELRKKQKQITPYTENSDLTFNYQVKAMQHTSYFLDENSTQPSSHKSEFNNNPNITELQMDSESIYPQNNNINVINMDKYQTPKDGPRNGDHITDGIRHDDVINIVQMYEENEANEYRKKKTSLDVQAKLDSKFDNLLNKFDQENILLQNEIDKDMKDQIQYKD